MSISRRQFLDLCKNASVGLGLMACVGDLEKALANPSAPSVIWLQGATCSGCSVSLLNRVSATAPTNIGDLLINTINLRYHPTLMGAAGQQAASIAKQAASRGNYVLAVEGGVPTAFGGATCIAWNDNGKDVTFMDAVKLMAPKASAILAVGTCAAWGGVPAAGSNPTAVQSVQNIAGKATINIGGCPAHPDWIVWTVAQFLLGNPIALDDKGRPSSLYAMPVHATCPRLGAAQAGTYGVDHACMMSMGCMGPMTTAPCPTAGWNNGVNFCTDSNSQCIGCTEPTFPLTGIRRPGGYSH